MYVLEQLLIGLGIAHLMWAYFFICGSLLRTPRISPAYRAEAVPRQRAALEVVISTASGIAITGTLTFLVGIMHGLYPIAAVLWLLVLAGLFFIFGDSPLAPAFWKRRAALVRKAASWPVVASYVLVLVAALPAVVADPGSDATAAYWPYALEWARAHHLLVDYWLRFPYYAYNWVLIETWMIELGATNWLNFLGWFSGCLCVVGIAACVQAFSPKVAQQGWRNAITLVAPLPLLLSPMFLHWFDTGLTDAAIGFFFLAVVASAFACLRFKNRYWLYDFVAIAAFFVGMKISLIAFIVPAVVVVLGCSLAVKMSRQRALWLVLALIAASSPWYLKNWIQAGDPIAPTLNLAVHGVDSKWSRDDMTDVMGDLKVGNDRKDLVRLPIDIVTATPTLAFREPGVTWLLLLLWLPGAVALYLCLSGRWRRSPTLVASSLLFYSVGYWIATSHLARYSLLFYAALAAFIGAAMAWLVTTHPRSRAFAFALLLFFAIPTPTSATWLSNFWQGYYLSLWSGYVDREQYLQTHSVIYPEMEYIGAALHDAKQPGPNAHIYGLRTEFAHFFALQNGFVLIGDWFGPERYKDFKAAIEGNAVAGYVQRFKLQGFIIPLPEMFKETPRAPSEGDLITFDSEMKQLHFTKVWKPGWHYIVYLAPSVS